MTSHLVQPYVDKENTASLTTNNSNKGRLGSLAGRQAAKTFSVGASPLVTPRKALGNLSNDATRHGGVGLNNSQKQPVKSAGVGGSGVFKKPLGSQSRTPGLSLRNPNLTGLSTQNSAPKSKMKPQVLLTTSTVNPVRQAENYPDIETMHIYQDKEADIESLPHEDCLSSYLNRVTSLRVPPRPGQSQAGRRHRHERDFSHLQLEPTNVCSCTPDIYLNGLDAEAPVSLNSCLDLPPFESVDFMNINNFKLWDEQTID